MSDYDFTNGLTPKELERLVLINEEAGEIVQAVSKIVRHGLQSGDPRRPPGHTNQLDLEAEIGHILAAIRLLEEAGLVNSRRISEHTAHKLATINQWLHQH